MYVAVKQKINVVIDTNLLVAAFFNKRSSSYRILKLVEEGKINFSWNEKIKKEAEKILGNIWKSVKSKVDKEKFLNNIFKKENKITGVPRVNIIKEDPSDNKFLGCALKSGAALIVSNDEHLLKIKIYEGIPIAKPKNALRAINKIIK
ncbi:MAG: putative toxin-antitoxin system toxin component, PIN family [Candidatus Portnoybacteria bacterium]|nr:putative toxin-antitoxin system toxin component, PIN family [Candidatus Portnoybacteria bacterium]